MTAPIGSFDHDIEMHTLWHDTPMDDLSRTILRALREGLISGEHPCSAFRDSPDGLTEIDGEYDLAFVARVIRARLR